MSDPGPIPRAKSCRALARLASACTHSPLYRNATQTVFGEGPAQARIMLVGEQPGDQKDLQGHPFVGPAGKLLDACLERAGLDRKQIYVTNAVKHFKWEPMGKRRLHKKPGAREIAACKPWLQAEIALIQPKVIVALGATAAKSLMGPQFRVSRDRGRFHSVAWAERFMATVHPSSLLRTRAPDREEQMQLFIRDLHRLKTLVSTPS